MESELVQFQIFSFAFCQLRDFDYFIHPLKNRSLVYKPHLNREQETEGAHLRSLGSNQLVVLSVWLMK